MLNKEPETFCSLSPLLTLKQLRLEIQLRLDKV